MKIRPSTTKCLYVKENIVILVIVYIFQSVMFHYSKKFYTIRWAVSVRKRFSKFVLFSNSIQFSMERHIFEFSSNKEGATEQEYKFHRPVS